jgi:hypothetical protein
MVADDSGSDDQEEGKKFESDMQPPQVQDSVLTPGSTRLGLQQLRACTSRTIQNLEAYSTLL